MVRIQAIIKGPVKGRLTSGGLHWLWVPCLLGKLIYKNNQIMGALCPLFLLLVVRRELKITSFGKGKEREAGSQFYKYRIA